MCRVNAVCVVTQIPGGLYFCKSSLTIIPFCTAELLHRKGEDVPRNITVRRVHPHLFSLQLEVCAPIGSHSSVGQETNISEAVRGCRVSGGDELEEEQNNRKGGKRQMRRTDINAPLQ